MRMYFRFLTCGPLVFASLTLPLCPSVSTASVSLDQRFNLTASDPAANDRLGTRIAIGGDSVVAAGDFDNDNYYVFDRATGNERFKLPIPIPGDSRWFLGSSVAADGNTAVVSGSRSDPSAYVFDLTTGLQQHHLTPDAPIPSSGYGQSVAVSGSLAVVGAYKDGSQDANLGGSAYIFDTTTGNQLQQLTADDPSANAFLGSSVAIDGNIAVLGAPRFNSGDTGLGSAYLFDVSTGNQLFKLTGSDTVAGDYFGLSVSISGNLAVVGSPSAGEAYVFDVTTGEELFKLTASDAVPGQLGFFGYTVSISHNTVIVGAHGDASGSGAVYLFDVTTGAELTKLVAAEDNLGAFGFSVALSGNTAAIGTRNDTINEEFRSGSAYIFDIVPEPGTLSVMSVGGMLLLRARRT